MTRQLVWGRLAEISRSGPMTYVNGTGIQFAVGQMRRMNRDVYEHAQ